MVNAQLETPFIDTVYMMNHIWARKLYVVYYMIKFCSLITMNR